MATRGKSQGHVYCFQCIHQWCKTQNDCPGCRVEIKRIVKTLSADDVAKEEARQKVGKVYVIFYI